MTRPGHPGPTAPPPTAGAGGRGRRGPARSPVPAGGERGSATLDLVAAFPAFLAVLLLVVQSALLIHARHIAQAAAQEGLRAARLYHGDRAAGERGATAFLDQTAGDLLTERAVTAARGRDRARVVVAGRALSVLPGVALRVRGVAEGPVERFTGDR